jgi:hypothetical protein
MSCAYNYSDKELLEIMTEEEELWKIKKLFILE